MIWAWLPKLRTLPRSFALKRSNPIHEPCRSPGAMLSPAAARGTEAGLAPDFIDSIDPKPTYALFFDSIGADRPLSLETSICHPCR